MSHRSSIQVASIDAGLLMLELKLNKGQLLLGPLFFDGSPVLSPCFSHQNLCLTHLWHIKRHGLSKNDTLKTAHKFLQILFYIPTILQKGPVFVTFVMSRRNFIKKLVVMLAYCELQGQSFNKGRLTFGP